MQTPRTPQPSWKFLGAGLASATLLAACGSGGAPSAHSSKSGNATLLSSSYRALENARSAETTIAETVRTAKGNEALSLTGTGALHWSPTYGSMDMTVVVPSSAASVPVRILFTSSDEYVSAPGHAGGSKWIEIPIGQFMATGSNESLNPAQTLKILEARAETVTDLGPAEIDGVKTVHYRAELNLSRGVKPALKPFAAAYERLSGESTVPVDIWINGRGLPRRITVDETIKHSPIAAPAAQAAFPIQVTVTMSFSNYGTTVAEPAAPTSGVVRLPPSALTTLLGGA